MQYEFVLRGRLTDALRDLFGPLAVRPSNSDTEMMLEIRDDAELYGVLDRLERLGMSIVSVRPAPGDWGSDD